LKSIWFKNAFVIPSRNKIEIAPITIEMKTINDLLLFRQIFRHANFNNI